MWTLLLTSCVTDSKLYFPHVSVPSVYISVYSGIIIVSVPRVVVIMK